MKKELGTAKDHQASYLAKILDFRLQIPWGNGSQIVGIRRFSTRNLKSGI
jgi:hypothetical protein